MKGEGNINLQIFTATNEANDFFVKHEADLIKSLQSAGIKLADMKVLSTGTGEFSMSSESSSKDNSSSDWTGHSQSKEHFQNKDRSSNGDSKRRQALWEQYKEKLGA